MAIVCSSVTLIAKEPENFYADKSLEALENGKAQEAYDYATLEIKNYKKNANGYYYAGYALWLLGDIDESFKNIEKGIKRGRKKQKDIAAKCFDLKADIQLYELKDTVAALATLDKGLKLFPEDKDLLSSRIKLNRNSSPDLALKDAEVLKRVDPKGKYAYSIVAGIYCDKQDFESALSNIDTAIQYIGLDGDLYLWRGYINKMLEKSPDWIHDMLKAYTLGNDDALYVYLAREESYIERFHILQEIDKFDMVGFMPERTKAYCNILWGDKQEAIQILEKYVDGGGYDEMSMAIIISLLNESSNFIRAYRYAVVALEKYPGSIVFEEEKINNAVAIGQGKAMLDEIDDFQKNYPMYANDLAKIKADTYMALGSYADAVSLYKSVANEDPSLLNYARYGDALRLSGLNNEADKIYKEYVIDKIVNKEEINDSEWDEAGFLAFSGLGDKKNSELILEINEDYSFYNKARLLARIGDKVAAIEALRKDLSSIGCIILADYDFHALHSEPDFMALMDECEIPTRKNMETGLLEFNVTSDVLYVPKGAYLEDVKKAINHNPGNWIAITNSMCPIDVGDDVQLVRVGLNNKNNVLNYNYYYSIGENSSKFTLLRDSKYRELFTKKILYGILINDPELVNESFTINHIHTSKDKKQKETLTVNTSQLKQVLKNKISQSDLDKLSIELMAYIDNLVSDENTYCSFEDNCFIGRFLIDDEDQFTGIELLKEQYKEIFIQDLKLDPVARDRIPLFVRNSVSLKYIYESSKSGKIICLYTRGIGGANSVGFAFG